MPWDPPDLDTDPDAVTNRILDQMIDKLDGWDPVEGAPEVVLAEEIGRETATTNQIASTFIELAAAAFGETVFGFPAYLGAAASILVQLEFTGVGEAVPDGFTVTGVNNAGVEVAFQLPTRVIATSTTMELTFTATEAGDVGNQVPPGDLTIVTATIGAQAATAVSASTGGADPEELSDYLDRLVDYLSTLRPGGVRGEDLATLARSYPGVERAYGRDLWDLDAQATSDRTVTVYLVDADGQPVPPVVRNAVTAQLAAVREVNFRIYVAAPTYQPLTVSATVSADSGVSKPDLQSAIQVALTAAISPATWGSTAADPTAWVWPVTLTELDLAAVVAAVPGVASVLSLQLTGLNSDHQFGDRSALPAPVAVGGSTVTVTVQ